MAARIRAVIFDFDGLLMDTESTNVASWEAEWSHWGLLLDREAFFVPHGGDVTEHRYDALAAAVGGRFDRSASRARRTAVRDDLNRVLRLSAGIDGWLEQAAALGLRTAVASSSDAAWVRRLLGQVAAVERFDVIVGGDEVAAHKPAPDVYRLALERLGLEAAEAVAVEDTPHGVAAAHGAGLACIAIPNPHVDPRAVADAEVVLESAEACSLVDAVRRAARDPATSEAVASRCLVADRVRRPRG